MQNKPHAARCGAKTRSGEPCKNYAMGNGRCRMHGGKSTGPKDKTKLKGNKNAEKHGFFSKYIPEETMNIIQEIQEKDPIDLLWDNIQIQYAAIIRSQRIMYVKDKEEMIKKLKKRKFEVRNVDGEHTPVLSEEEYEFQFAWDRQAAYLQAQSRAMAELRNMISKYDELCKSEMATEEQRLRVEKLKVDIDKVKAETRTENNSTKITIVDKWIDKDED